jgi:membrane-associated phospholipid phosphatase
MSRARKAVFTGALFFTYLAVYWLIQSFIDSSEVDYLIPLDDAIPFLPEFVWIYHTLVFGIFTVMVLLIQDKRLFMRTFWACITAAVLMSIIHVIWPAVYPRQEFTATSISEWLVEITRQIDGASNTFPSGHVAFSWLMFFAVCKAKVSRINRGMVSLFLLWAIGVSLSTLVIKQHFVADVFSGVATALISFCVAGLFVGYKRSLTSSYC